MHRTLCLAATLLALHASAQDLGLDLSEAKTPLEFRPSILFIGITPSEADAMLSARARLLESELLASIAATEEFSVVKTPSDAAQVTTDARKCLDFACLEGLAEKLGVNRIVSGALSKQGPGTVVVFSGFDATFPAVLPAQVESNDKQDKAALGGFAGIAGKSQLQRDKEFVAKAKPVFNELLKALATPLGKISVDVIEQKAVTRVKGKELGTGNFEKAVPAGAYELETMADGFLTFSTTVHVEPMKVSQVAVSLVAKEVIRPVVEVKPVDDSNAVYRRPGTYLAAAGLIAMCVGFGMGAMASSIEGNAIDRNHDGIVDITRAQAKSAPTYALLASVLIPVGAALLGVGGVWAFVLPVFFRKPTPAAPALTPSEGEGSGFGATFGVMGHF